VSRGRGWMGNPELSAAASLMKLWVDPVSRSTTTDAAPSSTLSCIVLQMGTPTTACSEKTGASRAASAAAAVSSVSSSSTPPM
jgi:hypothetical protein